MLLSIERILVLISFFHKIILGGEINKLLTSKYSERPKYMENHREKGMNHEY